MTKTSSSKRRPANPPCSLVSGLSLSYRGVGASRSGRWQQVGRQMGHFHIRVAGDGKAGEGTTGTTSYYRRCMYLTLPCQIQTSTTGIHIYQPPTTSFLPKAARTCWQAAGQVEKFPSAQANLFFCIVSFIFTHSQVSFFEEQEQEIKFELEVPKQTKLPRNKYTTYTHKHKLSAYHCT